MKKVMVIREKHPRPLGRLPRVGNLALQRHDVTWRGNGEVTNATRFSGNPRRRLARGTPPVSPSRLAPHVLDAPRKHDHAPGQGIPQPSPSTVQGKA